jgi:hypothetical protein
VVGKMEEDKKQQIDKFKQFSKKKLNEGIDEYEKETIKLREELKNV